jgi:outer membrane murein-binding lipoprotein Lpp
VPISSHRGGSQNNPHALGSAGGEGGLLSEGGGGAHGKVDKVSAAMATLAGAQSKQAARLDAMQAQLQAAKMAARLQAANAQNTALLEQLNSVSYVGSDLRSALAAPAQSSTDLPQQPPHPSGQAPTRRHSPKVMQQPLYAGYPNVAQVRKHTSFALPFNAKEAPFYQDRLGTNIPVGKAALKKSGWFLAGAVQTLASAGRAA